MGLFDRIRGKDAKRDASEEPHSVDPKVKYWFESSARKKGWVFQSWEGEIAWIVLNGTRHFINLGNFLSALARQGGKPTVEEIDGYVQYAHDMFVAEEEQHRLIENFSKIRSLLRSRLLASDLAQSQPQLASEPYVPGELAQAVAIDWGKSSTYVTHDFLKSWGVTFDEALTLGKQNVIMNTRRDHFIPFEEVPSILICSPDDGIGSSRALIVQDIFPNISSQRGFLFSVPSNDVALIHLPTGNDSIVIPPLMFQIAIQAFSSQSHPVNAAIFWHHETAIQRIGLQASKDRSGKIEIAYIETQPTRDFVQAMKSIE